MGVNITNTLNTLDNWETKIKQNKVTNFAYTQEAYNNISHVNGVTEYDVSAENNIPVADADVIKVNSTVISKGFRSKASSLTRMLMNHFFGRVSYNLNKIHDNFQTLLTVLKQGFHPVYIATNSQNMTNMANNMTFNITCPNFVLEAGARLYVTFFNAPIISKDTTIFLNVNSTGAKKVTGYPHIDYIRPWGTAETVEFLYDGTQWFIANKNVFVGWNSVQPDVLYLGV